MKKQNKTETETAAAVIAEQNHREREAAPSVKRSCTASRDCGPSRPHRERGHKPRTCTPPP